MEKRKGVGKRRAKGVDLYCDDHQLAFAVVFSVAVCHCCSKEVEVIPRGATWTHANIVDVEQKMRGKGKHAYN